MSVNMGIHGVRDVRVDHFNRNNNHSVSLQILGDSFIPDLLTLYGSADVLERLVEAFGDENTKDYSEIQVTS